MALCLLSFVLPGAGGIGQGAAAMPAADFDPNATIPVLLSEAFTGDEVPIGGILDIAQEAPHGENVIAEIEVFANGGFITYDFYPSAALTMQDGMIEIGDHEDLPEHPGVTAYLLWSDGSAQGAAAACVPEQNVMICGGSWPQILADAGFDYGLGASEAMALHLAGKGLTHFERVVTGATKGASVPPVVTATLPPVAAPSEPTARASLPTNTPFPTATVPPPTPTAIPITPVSSTAHAARDYLPDRPDGPNAACFTVQGSGAYPAADVDAFLARAGAGDRATAALGWIDGAYIDFRCAEPTPGEPNFLEVVVHRFASPALARAALPYWQAGYRPAGDESYQCSSIGSVVVCADGSRSSSPPAAEVELLLDQVIAIASSAGSAAPTIALLSLQTLIPATLSLSPGQAFRLYDEGAATFDSVVANSPDPATAERELRDWGWAENAYRVFAADDPPRNAAGWVELSIDRFNSVGGAAQALVAYADDRRASHNLQGVDLGLFSDQSEAMRGPAYNGNEVTIFARRGDLVVRATGITPRGDPTADVIEAILKILVPLVDEPRVVSTALSASLPTDAAMPAGLRMSEEHARSAATIAETFPDSAMAEQLFQHWGWRENAARVFTGRSAAGTTRLEVSAFRLADADMAAQALDFFLRGRESVDGLSEIAPPDVGISGLRTIAGPVAGGQEATVYFARGATLFRVTAIGAVDPMRDLTDLLRSWR